MGHTGGEALWMTIFSHPLYSSDLAASDFWALPMLKCHLGGECFQTGTEVQSAVNAFFWKNPIEFYTKGISRLLERYAKYLKREGDYVENNVTQILSKYIISSLYIDVYIFYGILGITFGTPLVILLTCWHKPHTNAGNLSLKVKKLLFLQIIFLNVSVRITFLEKISRKKIIPHKIFYENTIHSSA